MSWGIKITVLYIGFVISITTMVFISASSKSELVSKDYYAQELKYQDRMDAISNEKKSAITINYEVLDQFIAFEYLQSEIKKDFKGEVLFFRPSDSSKDVKLNLAFDKNGEQIVQKKLLAKGVYKMCISWKNNNTLYYKEEIINI